MAHQLLIFIDAILCSNGGHGRHQIPFLRPFFYFARNAAKYWQYFNYSFSVWSQNRRKER